MPRGLAACPGSRTPSQLSPTRSPATSRHAGVEEVERLVRLHLDRDLLAMVAQFEPDLIRLRTKDGVRVTKAKGPSTGHAAQTQPTSSSAPGFGAKRRVQHSRGRGSVRRRT